MCSVPPPSHRPTHWPRGSSATCYTCSGSRVGSFIRVWVPVAVLAERRSAAQVSDARLLIAAVGEAGLGWLVKALGQDKWAAVCHFGLEGAAGDEAPGVVLRGVGQTEVTAVGPCCGALIVGGCSQGDTLPHLFLLQLSDLLLIT